MKKIILILLFGFLLFSSSCKYGVKENDNTQLTYIEKLKSLPDNIKVEDIIIKNLFKSQILAHQGNTYDSIMIIEKVYKPHQALWDSCYAMIFGKENAPKFNTIKGMISWNKTLYPENKEFFDQRAKILLKMNFDSILKTNLLKNRSVDAN